MTKTKDNKYRKLFFGLLFDAIGMLSFTVPLIGDFSDIIWAPLAGWLMTRMYKGKIGQGAGLFTFLEEIIPGLDIIPTFTIMWFYTYVFKKSTLEKTIEV
ncbi:hypothetical protein [Cytophaga sp. FL35]|uniref:hypothetical protein n=1 Tax=Cytophaga sp. FL35 TaxID=1904456 RepID=UPI0016537052|nr:hypothetical protein [Cytophaga sp. FL35]MBC7000125.1 hypothetical protein [Cytophaga sp. FL35]